VDPELDVSEIGVDTLQVPRIRRCESSVCKSLTIDVDSDDGLIPMDEKSGSSFLLLRAPWAQHVEVLETPKASQSSIPVANPEGLTLGTSTWSPVQVFGHLIIGSSTSLLQKCVSHPSSLQRLLWDFTSLLVIGYDILTLPLMVFKYDEMPAARWIRLLTTIFWTADIPLSFLVGYHKDGLIDMRPRSIAQRYLRTWFFPELIIVTSDWLIFLLVHFSGALTATRLSRSMGRALRLAKVLRMLRLLRIIKLGTLVDRATTLVFSEHVLAFLSICKLIAYMGLICHFVACGWYMIGTLEEDQKTWVMDLQELHPGKDMIFHYLVCVHWAFAQFTGASSPYHPVNFAEELFTVMLLIFGLVVFSSFLGSVTGTITEARNRIVRKTQQDSLIRRFVFDNHVSLDLGNRITHFLQQHHRQRTRVLEKDVPALQELPGTLIMQLRAEVFAPILSTHPFFRCILLSYPSTLKDICKTAMQQKLMLNKEEVFYHDMEANTMVFVLGGCCEYVSSKSGCGMLRFNEGQWLCEGALWVKWRHKGQLTVHRSCDIAELSAGVFTEIAQRHNKAFRDINTYAKHFVAAATLGGSRARNLDIWGSPDEVMEITGSIFGDLANHTTPTHFIRSIIYGTEKPR